MDKDPGLGLDTSDDFAPIDWLLRRFGFDPERPMWGATLSIWAHFGALFGLAAVMVGMGLAA